MNEEQAQLVQLLQKAVSKVYEEERFLLQFDDRAGRGLEQAFVFRTGVHLNNLIAGTKYNSHDIDSEYNKVLGNSKAFKISAKKFRPDLIIHKRDSNDDNKLVVEFKGYWLKNNSSDLKKLENLTNPNDNFQYLVGVFVQIGRERPTYRIYLNGVENV